MRSQEVNPMTVLNEVRILKSECHPCIINLKNVIDKPNFLFIVMDLAEEGEHFYKIIEKTKLNEQSSLVSGWVCLKCLDRSGSEFWFQNTCEKSKIGPLEQI